MVKGREFVVGSDIVNCGCMGGRRDDSAPAPSAVTKDRRSSAVAAACVTLGRNPDRREAATTLVVTERRANKDMKNNVDKGGSGARSEAK